MQAHRGRHALGELCSGPGKLTQALGVELSDNGCDLTSGPVVISGRPERLRDPAVQRDRRIGITKATELPWRFCLAGSPFLSRPVSSAG
jgi:DNA-3-methyladenine glycosylase